MSNEQHWLWHWLLGIAAIAFLNMAQSAMDERDEALRRAKPAVELHGITLEVSCPKPGMPTAAPGAQRPQPRFIL